MLKKRGLTPSCQVVSGGEGETSVEHAPLTPQLQLHHCHLQPHHQLINPSWSRDIKNRERLNIYWKCYHSGKVNACASRIPLPSNWNLRLLRSLCQSRSDREVATYLTYGWPLNRREGPVSQTFFNHSSATEYPEQIRKYITKEMKHDTLLGPFLISPFKVEVTGVSPMSTRPKKGTTKRRVIVDLSWPPGGASVNEYIPKDSFMEQPVKLVYPTIDKLCRRAAQIGSKAFGWKKDMERAFRQVPLDPLAWSFLGVCWEGLLYFDLAEVMGCRSAPYVMQRVTSMIRHVMVNLQHCTFNYVDDFMGIDLITRAWEAFNTLGHLLRDLGVNEAEDKMVAPCQIIEFLGIIFDFIRQLILVPQDKLKEIRLELRRVGRGMVTMKQLQSLAGKLQFAATCVRPGRVFIIRLYQKIAELDRLGLTEIQLDEETLRDIRWWSRYMKTYNGVSIMWMEQSTIPNAIMATDASLTGMGGVCGQEFYHIRIPGAFRRNKEIIADFEMLAILIAIRIWSEHIKGTRFTVDCDNQVVVAVLNGQSSKNKFLQTCLREITKCLAENQCEMVVTYINTKANTRPDWLSRWEDPICRKKFQESIGPEWREVVVGKQHYAFTRDW